MAAEWVGGALLSGTFQVLFERLASREVVESLQGKKPSDDLICDLKNVLVAVNAVLDDAEGKQLTNPYVKQWLDELEDASYVADDLLDELATHALQSKLEASGGKVFLNYFSIPRKSYIRDMKKRLKGVLGRLETLEKRIVALELIKGVSDKKSSRLPTTSLVDESEIYGREGDKEAIIKLLLKDDVEGKVFVIPIVGMGGIGKTTLAQSVYNDQNVEERFDLKSWVCVSEEFDICKVTKTVLCAVTKSPSHFYCGEDLNSLQTRLKEALTGKKFFIVLDDVWNENYENWDKVRVPFKHGAQGSKILVTTRNENVARIMHSVPLHNLGPLTNEDCWQLFVKHAFDNKDCNAYPALVTIGRKIVQKCKGLPLAAKTLGGLLRSIEEVAQWERILESKIWDMPGTKSNILPALMLSYHYLPSSVKRCFAFCAIFPKGYLFQRQQLVSLWMAENLLPEATGNERLEDIGDGYFNELLSSSFFQRSISGSWFVMHDLIHDLAKFISRGYCFTFENGNSNKDVMKVRHLAVASRVSSQRFGCISKAIHLRTLLPSNSFYSFENLSNEVVNDTIVKLRHLRTLSLYGFKNLVELSDSIVELKQLRFLDLSATSIQRLPNLVCKLYNLQTLNLSLCSKLIELPEDMHHLINLRHLDISGCDSLVKMPRRIGELKSLQTLSNFIVGEDSGAKINELRELSDLHGGLQLKKLQNVASARDALEAKLKDKKHLEGLRLFWSHSNDTINYGDGEVIESLLPHTNLKRLCITGYGGESFPNWLGVHLFSNITFIKLEKCECTSLPPLGQLPSLKTLNIEQLRRVVSVGAEFFGFCGSVGKPFASLELLSFVNMSGWQNWSCNGVEDGEVCPKLQELKIIGCYNLCSVEWPNSLPSLAKLEFVKDYSSEVVHVLSLPRTPALRELKLGVCEKLRLKELPETAEWIDIGGNNGVESLIEAFKNGQTCFLKKLRIHNCCSEITFPVGWLPTTLTELKIDECGRFDFQGLHQRPLKIPSIQNIDIVSCHSLVFFPLDAFPSLIWLRIMGCKCLESVGVYSDGDGAVVEMESLSNIIISGCRTFTSFLEGGGLHAPNLTNLAFSLNDKLKKLPEQMRKLFPSLRRLDISECQEIESFPEDGFPSNLIVLRVWECPKLVARRMHWNLHTIQALEFFKISDQRGGGGVESFPEEDLLPSNLSSLIIIRLPHLKSLDIKGLQQFTSLKRLYIQHCRQLEKLPQQRLPISLEYLEISGCPFLTERCQREIGQDWNFISHIPHIEIGNRRI